jgi:hypothetical protein
MWLVDADCAFYDHVPTTILDEPTSVHVPPYAPEESIATLRQFSPQATALLTDLTEARPLIRSELTLKTPNGGQLISGLFDCAATVDFELEDIVRRFSLIARSSQTKTPIRLAHGQRVTSKTVYDITVEL